MHKRTQMQREFFIDNLMIRIHYISEMIWWAGLAPWESEFPFSVLTSTSRMQVAIHSDRQRAS